MMKLHPSDPCGGGELTSLAALRPTHTHVHTGKYIYNKRKVFLKVNYLEKVGYEGDEPDVVEHTCNPQCWGSRGSRATQ